MVVSGGTEYSRLQVFSTCLVLCMLNCLAWSVYSGRFLSRAGDRVNFRNLTEPFRLEKSFSYPLLVMDFVLVVAAFFLLNLIKRGTLVLPDGYVQLLVIFVGLWFTVSMVTGKYAMDRFGAVYHFTWQWIKASGIILAGMAVLMFAFRLFYFSRLHALGAVLALAGMETVLALLYFRAGPRKAEEKDIESADRVKQMLGQEEIPLDVNIALIRQKLMEPAREKIRRQLSEAHPGLFELLDRHIDLNEMVRAETAVERTVELYDLNGDRLPARLFLNLWKINDIRRLNAYLLKMHQLLLPGGYFAGYAHTIHTHYDWAHNKFPRYMADLVYGVDFCFHRVMPKLPGLQKIYFALTRGKGRVLSRAEVLGRLCFCGFEIVAEQEVDKRLYVIARKVKTSSLDESPTYGPMVTLKRTGFQGKTVNIYKFRTMHPYSEYLQQYVYELQGLQAGGKLENDFRMTAWGRIMRKFWLDELPMLYNWVKGDLDIVGVRPLCFHYLELYDPALKELRTKVKPGLIPPFYADRPETFEEICDSERRYIESCLKRPVTTRLAYFWKAFVNIAIKGARSN